MIALSHLFLLNCYSQENYDDAVDDDDAIDDDNLYYEDDGLLQFEFSILAVLVNFEHKMKFKLILFQQLCVNNSLVNDLDEDCYRMQKMILNLDRLRVNQATAFL